VAMLASYSISGSEVLVEVARQIRMGGSLGWLTLLWPNAFLVVYASYGTAFFFLYWLASLCRGEGAGPDFRMSGVERGKTRRLNLRPGVVMWWVLPVALLVFVLIT